MFKHNALLWIQILSIESFGSTKFVSKKCCKNSKMQAEACSETKTTKILALNTKFRKKSLASKLKGLLKSVALNPDSRKVLFRNEKVYWKVCLYSICTPTYTWRRYSRKWKIEKKGNKQKNAGRPWHSVLICLACLFPHCRERNCPSGLFPWH